MEAPAPMDPTVIVGDLVYRDLVHRRGAKSAEELSFADPVPFRVSRASPDELPIAVACDLTGPDGRTSPGAYRHGPDGFMASCGHPQALGSLLPGRVHATAPGPGEGFPFGRLRYYGEDDGPQVRAKVLASGRDAALALANEAAARARIVDDALWIPAPPPVIEVRQTWRNDGLLPVSYVAADAPRDWRARFHIADLDAAAEHAAWSSGHPWLGSRGMEVRLPKPARIEAMPDRDAFYRTAAGDLFRRLQAREMWEGFHALPLPVLEHWLAYRRAASLAEAGDAASVATACEALGAILDRVPGDPGPTGRAVTAEQGLRRLLEEPVRHWRTYLRGLAPGPDADRDDDAALSGLAR